MTNRQIVLLVVVVVLILFLVSGPFGVVPLGPLERLKDPLAITIAAGYILGRIVIAVGKWLWARVAPLLP